MSDDNNAKMVARIIARCWADPDFKASFKADPAATFAAEGMELPADTTVKVVENDSGTYHFVIPEAPVDLSDEQLDGVAGGIDLPFGMCIPVVIPVLPCGPFH